MKHNGNNNNGKSNSNKKQVHFFSDTAGNMIQDGDGPTQHQHQHQHHPHRSIRYHVVQEIEERYFQDCFYSTKELYTIFQRDVKTLQLFAAQSGGSNVIAETDKLTWRGLEDLQNGTNAMVGIKLHCQAVIREQNKLRKRKNGFHDDDVAQRLEKIARASSQAYRERAEARGQADAKEQGYVLDAQAEGEASQSEQDNEREATDYSATETTKQSSSSSSRRLSKTLKKSISSSFRRLTSAARLSRTEAMPLQLYRATSRTATVPQAA